MAKPNAELAAQNRPGKDLTSPIYAKILSWVCDNPEWAIDRVFGHSSIWNEHDFFLARLKFDSQAEASVAKIKEKLKRIAHPTYTSTTSVFDEAGNLRAEAESRAVLNEERTACGDALTCYERARKAKIKHSLSDKPPIKIFEKQIPKFLFARPDEAAENELEIVALIDGFFKIEHAYLHLDYSPQEGLVATPRTRKVALILDVRTSLKPIEAILQELTELQNQFGRQNREGIEFEMGVISPDLSNGELLEEHSYNFCWHEV